MELSRAEILRYSHYLLIPKVDLESQKKLKWASVAIIDTVRRGYFCPAAYFLFNRIGAIAPHARYAPFSVGCGPRDGRLLQGGIYAWAREIAPSLPVD